MSCLSLDASTPRGLYRSIHSCWVFLISEVNTGQLDLCVGILMFVQKNEGGVKFCLFCCIDSSSKAYHREGDTEMLSDMLSSNRVAGQGVVANERAAQHHIEQQPPTPTSDTDTATRAVAW